MMVNDSSLNTISPYGLLNLRMINHESHEYIQLQNESLVIVLLILFV